MKLYTPLLVAAAAAVAVTGCSRTTVGSVAMTTEPGPPINRTVAPTAPRAPFPFPFPLPIPGIPGAPGSPGTTEPRTPGSTDPQSIVCRDYQSLDSAAQRSVIQAILAKPGSALPRQNYQLAKTLADALCTFLPDAPVSSLLVTQPR